MSTKPAYQYTGTAYRQSRDPSAPWLISFVAPAEELLEWAGIPRRSDTELVGFQRPFDEKRIDRAKEFFELGRNQSPTALVVGLHEKDSRVKLEFLDSRESETVRPCRLTIAHSPADFSTESAIDFIRRQLDARLLANGEDLSEDTDTDSLLDAQPEDLAEDIDGDDDDDDEIEIGRSMIAALRAKLDDSAWCTENADSLLDMAKPATIIDGQHRVKGAEACERKIPFCICAIHNCDWAEQVFQFTVVNYTAKGIPDQFITANAALSLTQHELQKLEDRLVQARVKVIEYELMRVVQFDSESPFFELVNLTEKKQTEKIGYKTMVRVAKAWYQPAHPALKTIISRLFPLRNTKGARKEQMRRWKDDAWGYFFKDFWQIIHQTYGTTDSHKQDHKLWDVGHSNLMIAVVLLEMQEAFFENLDAQDEEYWEIKDSDDRMEEMRRKVRRRADKFVEWFPPDFFSTPWRMKSLNTSAGRKALQEAIANLAKSKGKYQYGKSALITGKVGN